MDFYLPGMIHIDGKTGKYPAISITGKRCFLGCLHCRGILLRDMIHVDTPEELVRTIKELERKGMIGALISGGCDREGRLPWDRFLPVIQSIETGLFLSAHAGLNVDKETAKKMKESPLSQVLIDAVFDEDTLREVYRLKEPDVVRRTVDNLFQYGPQVIPHVIAGIYWGKMKSEYETLDILADYNPDLLVIVVIMPLNPAFSYPSIEEVLSLFREARKKFKKISLGCARPRGSYRHELERRLIEEGLVDRMALWSDTAIRAAEAKNEELRFHYTCCSVR